MSLPTRIARLERQPNAASMADDAIRAMAEATAREHDLDVDELVEEIRRVLAMTPAELEAERQWSAAALEEGTRL